VEKLVDPVGSEPGDEAESQGGGPDEQSLLSRASRAPLDPIGLWSTLETRIFATNQFFRLWVAQVVTSTGNWLFFFAITITAARVGGEMASASVGFVVAARLLPGLFLSQVAGVLADRWDRRKLMVVTDLSRAGVVLFVPFIDHVWQLVLISLAMEGFTLLWIPAKEASVPNLIPRSHLTTANSLAVVATYGTVLMAALILLGLAAGAARIENFAFAEWLRIDETSLSFYVDSVTYLISAALIASLAITKPEQPANVDDNKIALRESFSSLLDGWRLIARDPVVRTVNLGLGAALVGGGMVIPLGIEFAFEVLGSGDRGYLGMVSGLGAGAAVGVLTMSLLQDRLRKGSVFVFALLATGLSLFLATSFASLTAVVITLVMMGFFAGPVYVIGFTLLHERVTDDLRGRIFAALYALLQLCALVALVIGPFFAEASDRLSDSLLDGSVRVLGFDYDLPGERIALWIGSLIIIGAGLLAMRSLRSVTSRSDRRTVLRSVD